MCNQMVTSEIREFEFGGFELPRVKYSECMTEIQRKSILVRVSEGLSYWELTVRNMGSEHKFSVFTMSSVV